MSLIHILVETGELEQVRALLHAEPWRINEVLDPTFPDQPLHIAAWQEQAALTQLLLEAGADINARGNEGYTPLHYAAYYGSVESAQVLLAAGAHPNLPDKEGHRPLLVALYGRDPECQTIAQLFIEHGARRDLNELVCLGDGPGVGTLLAEDKNAVQQALLPHALCEDTVNMVAGQIDEALLEGDRTPDQEAAVMEQHQDVLLYLLRAGADLSAVGHSGLTPLANAVQSGCAPLVRLALGQGADPYVPLPYGTSLFKSIGEPGKDQVRAVLREFDLNPDAPA